MLERKTLNNAEFIRKLMVANTENFAIGPTFCQGFLLSDVVVMRQIGQFLRQGDNTFLRPVRGLLERPQTQPLHHT